MRIVIEAKEATSFSGSAEIGELFEFNVATESADIFTGAVRLAADAALRVLKENRNGGTK